MPERGLAFFADSPVAWQMFELLLKLKSAMPPPIDGTNTTRAKRRKNQIANVGTGVVLPTLHDDDAAREPRAPRLQGRQEYESASVGGRVMALRAEQSELR